MARCFRCLLRANRYYRFCQWGTLLICPGCLPKANLLKLRDIVDPDCLLGKIRLWFSIKLIKDTR